MASLPVQGLQHLTRLTTAARLARMRPLTPVEVDPPGVLRTERLVIRPLKWTDREEYIEAVRSSRAELDRFCTLHRDDELDDELFDRQLQLGRAADATGRAWRRVAEDRAKAGRIVGAFNLNDITHGLESHAEMSAWVRTDDAGRGFAAEAIRAVLAHAFGARWTQRIDGQTRLPGLGLSRVDGLISPSNTPCLALVEKLGFVRSPDRSPQQLVVRGRKVEHLPFVAFAPLAGELGPESAVPAGVSLAKSIAALLSIERRAAVRGE